MCPSAVRSFSPQVFSVRPSRGVLPRAGSEGHQFVVSFTPFEYGKMAVGVLVIVTADMQWSYEVRALIARRLAA